MTGGGRSHYVPRSAKWERRQKVLQYQSNSGVIFTSHDRLVQVGSNHFAWLPMKKLS